MSNTDALNELDKIVELFSSKELPEVCAKVLIESKEKPSSKWSLGNQLLMILNNTADARGFGQWKEAGRYVKKGSHAIYILAPMVGTRDFINKDPQTGEVTTEKRKCLYGFKGLPVFRFEDTDGQDLSEYQPRDIPPLMEVADSLGLKVRYERVRGELGHYQPSNKEIVLGSENWMVFFHELGHAADDKIQKHDLTDKHQGEREAVAQLTAAVLSRIYGRNEDGFSWNYMSGLVGEKNPEAVGRLCIRVLSKVQKAINLILETEEKIAVPKVEEAPIVAK